MESCISGMRLMCVHDGLMVLLSLFTGKLGWNADAKKLQCTEGATRHQTMVGARNSESIIVRLFLRVIDYVSEGIAREIRWRVSFNVNTQSVLCSTDAPIAK